MATLAVGDIHGNLAALQDLLEKVIPRVSPEDTLVFLGDYIDRGPDARGCVETIIRLKETAQCSVTTILGNHEQWMLNTLQDYSRHSWLLGMEAFDTISSYSKDVAAELKAECELAGVLLVTNRVELHYEKFFNLLPPSHIEFFQNLRPFYQSPDVICVHGGVDVNRSETELETHDLNHLIWGSDDFPERYSVDKMVAYGHHDNAVMDEQGWPWPRILNNRTFGLDTISHGVLTAMRFPDLRVFQSRQYPGTRT